MFIHSGSRTCSACWRLILCIVPKRVIVRLRLPSLLYSWCICQQRWTHTFFSNIYFVLDTQCFDDQFKRKNRLKSLKELYLKQEFYVHTIFSHLNTTVYCNKCKPSFPFFVLGRILGSCPDLWEIPSWILQLRAGKGPDEHTVTALCKGDFDITRKPVTGSSPQYCGHAQENCVSEDL